MFVEDDDRLENETTEPGKLEKSGAIAYVLYLGMKFEDDHCNVVGYCITSNTLLV